MKLLGLGSHICVRQLYCEVVGLNKGGVILQVLTGHLIGSRFTASYTEVCNALR